MLSVYSFFSILLLTSSLLAESVNEIPDPYRWLEEDNERVNEWLEKQKIQSSAYFKEDQRRQTIKDSLGRLADIESLGIPYREGERCFILSRQKGQQQPAIYEINKDSTLRPVVDLSQSHGDKVAIKGFEINSQKPLIAYGISHSGSDWEEWHFRNIDTGEELPEIIKEIKGDPPLWDNKGEGIYYFRYTEDKTEDSSDHQDLYYHRLGTEVSTDKKLYTTPKKGLMFYNLDLEDHYLIFTLGKGASISNGIILKDLRNNPLVFKEIFPVIDGIYYKYIGSLEGRLYFQTNENSLKGKIISIDPEKMESESIREHFSFCEGFIQETILLGNKFIINYLKDASSRIAIYDAQGKQINQIELPRLCTINLSTHNGTQKDTNTPEFFYTAVDYLSPRTVYRANTTGSSEIFLSSKISWKPQDYQIKQIFYPSKDGTLIPMFIVSKVGIKLDGNNPLLLYGYGGFFISVTPSFSSAALTWLEMGGIYAVANLRGGGEYGEPWHQAGMLRNKQNVFDDFIAGAEWLCAQKYTNSTKIAIHGGSNGGLLVGACLLQRPDLFKAGIAGVGVHDMLRFHKFTVGWAWVREYGSPDDPEDAKYLYSYSPYHQVKPGVAYPATLITTADHDDRVVPLHSFKFAAALQAAQCGTNPILLRVYENMGHGAGKSHNDSIRELTDLLYFLSKELQ